MVICITLVLTFLVNHLAASGIPQPPDRSDHLLYELFTLGRKNEHSAISRYCLRKGSN
jgi:hypothetical protein